MTRLTRHSSTAAIAGLAFFLTAAFAPAVGLACLAEYRSPDWLLGHSPLVFIGTVEKVEDGRVSSVKTGRRSVDRDPAGKDDGKPTIATVRITQILKGEYSETRVRVGSGPCRSCGPEWYYAFERGRQYIFILPEYPKVPSQERRKDPQAEKKELSKNNSTLGESPLQWGGSLLPLSETSLIESEIARLVVYRHEYLAAVQRDRPKVFTAGVGLAQRMRKEKAQWIAMEEDRSGKREEEYLVSQGQIAASLVRTLAETPVEAVRVALAEDWFREKADPWWEQPIWQVALNQLVESRKAEVTTLNHAWVRDVLTRAGVETRHIDEYLQYQKTNANCPSRCALAFPSEAPGVDVYSHEERNEREQALFNSALTTDFILRYHTHYRGMMVPTYAGDFSAEVLAGLDPKRVRIPVAAMYHGPSERLNWLATQAIAHMPGSDFVNLPVEAMMENGKPWAWRILERSKTPKSTAERLGVMIDLVSQQYNPWGQAAFWRILYEDGCFHPTCIDKAIAVLERVKEASRKDMPGESDEDSDAENAHLADAVRFYLDAAKAHRNPPEPPKSTAAEYRRWFIEHPEKTKSRSKKNP